MLRLLGYNRPMPEAGKSALKMRGSFDEDEQPTVSTIEPQASIDDVDADGDGGKNRRVTFVLDEKRLRKEQAQEEHDRERSSGATAASLVYTAPTSSRKSRLSLCVCLQ